MMEDRWLKLCFASIAMFCLSSCSSVYFYPQKTLVNTPDQGGIAYETVTINSADGTKLSAWLLKTTAARKGVVYFLHGNAENISTHIASVYWLPAHGYDVLMLDYRGFGLSEGEPSLPEVFYDIDAGYHWLAQRYADEKNIALLGQSIGATMAIHWLAQDAEAQQRINRIVLDAPFPSYPGMVEDVLQRNWLTWLFAKPVSWFFTSRYDAVKSAAAMPATTPLLFFHSRDDQVIPFAFSSEVFEKLPQSKIEVVCDGRHIATFNYVENRQRLLDFLAPK